MAERRVHVALPPLDHGQLPMQKCAVRRRGEGVLIRNPRVVQAACGYSSARRLDHLLDVTETKHLDPALDIRQRRLDLEGRLERGQCVGVALDGKQCLALADQSRHVGGRRRQGGFERRDGAVVLAPRQGDVGFAGLRRVEPGTLLQRRGEFAARVAEIVVLQIPPSAIELLDARGALKRRRHRGEHELGMPGCRRQRRGRRPRRAGGHRQQQPADDG